LPFGKNTYSTRSAAASGQNTAAVRSGDAGAIRSGGALAAGRGALTAARRSMRAARAMRRPTDGRVALRRWCLDECRKPPNIAPKITAPSTAPGPNLGRASALEGTASDKATAPRTGIVQGRMTVLRPVATEKIVSLFLIIASITSLAHSPSGFKPFSMSPDHPP
jgi:hypothetical protein